MGFRTGGAFPSTCAISEAAARSVWDAREGIDHEEEVGSQRDRSPVSNPGVGRREGGWA